ncbi:N-glycosylase/DNA lyase [Hippea alviniae]|uniref:N-glycosylase/DNA lyase n=1 Tax=Hippea alviniae TaxID=1279027 RepID=UPI0003B30031|nr:N-glycosylase/DNA lyase [Hippea alviniae]
MEKKLLQKKIVQTYKQLKSQIETRLKEFRSTYKKSDLEIFKELLFCILTPQSKAEKAWQIIKDLEKENLILETPQDILEEKLKNVRFRFNKTKYIKEAQDRFVKGKRIILKEIIEQFNDEKEIRRWLINNVKGLGMKEASHFLRNIGKGENLSILDRHILRALKELEIIDEIPKTLTSKRYEDIELKMKKFADEINMSLSHLDFVLWQIQTGRIFK